MNEHALPVVNEAKCTACGDCVEACPKDLFSIQPVNNRLWVACKSLANGDEVLEACDVGCTACGKCAMDHPGEVIKMENHLPVIDYSAGVLEKVAIDRCPTGAIVWYDDLAGMIKGQEAKKVIRVGERKAPTVSN